MRRSIEWFLALGSAALCTLDALSFWKYIPGPGTPHWPLTAFPLTEIIVLGWIGAIGVALDGGKRSNLWGALPWVATGCMAPYALLGALSFGPLLVPAGGMLVAAGLLANRRRNRSILPDLTYFSVGAVINMIIILNVIKTMAEFNLAV